MAEHARARRHVTSRYRGASSAEGNQTADNQDWERVMHTKLAQWRFMHLVALDELSSAERAAVAEISKLSASLELDTTKLHALECKLARARAIQTSESFSERAAPALQKLQSGLASAAPAHDQVCTALVTALRRLRTSSAGTDTGSLGAPEKLAAALDAYRDAADAFVNSARKANVPDPVAAAQALTQLEKVAISMQQDALANAAKQVANATDAMDEERASRATAVLTKEKVQTDRGIPVRGAGNSVGRTRHGRGSRTIERA